MLAPRSLQLALTTNGPSQIMTKRFVNNSYRSPEVARVAKAAIVSDIRRGPHKSPRSFEMFTIFSKVLDISIVSLDVENLNDFGTYELCIPFLRNTSPYDCFDDRLL